jgi:Cu/Ag efflux protein CusF
MEELLNGSLSLLKAVVVFAAEVLAEISERLSALEKVQLKLKERIKKLRKEKCKILDEFHDMDKKARLTHMTGLFAEKFEQKIIDWVLGDLVTPDQCLYTIDHMEGALRGDDDNYDDVFETEGDLETANRRWSEFKSEFSWQGRYTRYIKHLKENQIMSHLSFEQREMEEALETGALKVRDRELFKEFLRIHEHLCARPRI